jgi:hypothetical protein
LIVVVIPPDSKSKSDLGYAGKDLIDWDGKGFIIIVGWSDAAMESLDRGMEW